MVHFRRLQRWHRQVLAVSRGSFRGRFKRKSCQVSWRRKLLVRGKWQRSMIERRARRASNQVAFRRAASHRARTRRKTASWSWTTTALLAWNKGKAMHFTPLFKQSWHTRLLQWMGRTKRTRSWLKRRRPTWRTFNDSRLNPEHSRTKAG